MHSRYKRRVLLSALVAIILIALLTLSTRPPATASAITITFLGYTNAQPGNNWRFALFSISNQGQYTVMGYDDSVEVEGAPDHKGPASHPGPFPAPKLKAAQTIVMAIGEPVDLSETGRWRFAMSFSRYTWRTWWLDKSSRRHLPLVVNPQRVIDPTSHVSATTAWLTK